MKILLPPLLLLAACGGLSIRDIRVAEDRRDLDVATLKKALESEDAAMRDRAAQAAGRMQDAALVPVLLTQLEREPDGTVRRTILFALGQMAFGEDFDGNLRGMDEALLQHASDFDPGTRRIAIEALGKLGGAKAAERLALALGDSSADVRAEAAIGLFRLRFMPVWTKRSAEPPALPDVAVNALVDASSDSNDQVRWRIAYALSRFGEPRAVAALRKLAADSHPYARLFATRALGRTTASAVSDSIRVALQDPDSFVRTEAVIAADRLKLWTLFTPALANDPSFHVRAAVARALAPKEAGHDDLLERLSTDASLTVRAETLASLVRRGRTEAGLQALRDPHWKIRKSVAAAGGLDIAEAALRDGDRRVRAAAIEALGPLADKKSGDLLRAALADPDVGIRIAAVGAIGSRKDLPVLDLLKECYGRSGKREEVELREEIESVAEKIPEASDLLREMMLDPSPSVRSKARRELRKRKETVPPVEAPKIPLSPFVDRAFHRLPVVVLDTQKGTIEIECLPSDAPVHVASFVELAKRGLYDGLIFHRVVSNFVVQGGDPRGDGSGDAGYSLRDEINQIPFGRGTVGMPKAGKDTGGCQFFITHTPTPHLDGAYTVFGRVVSGLEVMDKLEEGDKIIRARVRD